MEPDQFSSQSLQINKPPVVQFVSLEINDFKVKDMRINSIIYLGEA